MYVVPVVSCCCCSHIKSQFNAVRGRRTGSNNSGVEEIPLVKTEAKNKNKHTDSTTADTREAKSRLLIADKNLQKEDEAKQKKQNKTKTDADSKMQNKNMMTWH